MNIKAFLQNKALSASIAIVICTGIAIGGSIGSYILGIVIMLPLGIAMYKAHNDKDQ
jgi:Na+/H+ antiporter NhaC